jgi:hypothetical protein
MDNLSLGKSMILLDSLTLNNFGQLAVMLRHELNVQQVKNWIQLGAQLAYFNDVCCGAIAWKQSGEVVYLTIFTTLPAYESRSIDSHLLIHCIDSVK